MKYKVCVDDNFHYMDESERYTKGEYETAEAAISAAKQIVNDYLISIYNPGMTADKLFENYRGYGEDPFIVSEDKSCQFSAWTYAEARSKEICNNSSLNTVEILKKLGFKPDSSVLSDHSDKLSYDFGNFELSASCVTNLRFAEIVMVAGVYNSGRILAIVEIQLPRRVESIEQCAAFIAWGIDNQIGKDFIPLVPSPWLDEGRNNFDTLPWIKKRKLYEQEQKLYEQRPKCYVDRDWFKLALRDLRLLLPNLEENDIFSVTFKDEILTISSRLKLIVLPAKGNNWTSRYEITAGNFQRFPKRINDKEVEASVWNNFLYLAHWSYPIDRTFDLEK